LRIVGRANWIWFVGIFIAVNFMAYLVVRYTKNIYESTSVIKLDVKKEATEFGIKNPIENQNLNLLSGEIEIIQSRLFLSRVVDSSDLDVSYHSIGRVLNDELYQSHPFAVRYTARNEKLFNTPIYFDEDGPNEFTLQVGEDGETINGRYNSRIVLDGLELTIEKVPSFSKGDEIGYFFTINSKEYLLDHMLNNLTAEPLNFNANTIRVSFKDNNPFKANAVLNKIDTIYLQYSNEQKNLATKQKIDWVSNELVNIEKKMENFETYFETFTLENKSNDLDEDLKKTVMLINQIDSQRFNLNQKLIDVESLMNGVDRGDLFISMGQRHTLPPTIGKNLEKLEELTMALEKLKLSYNEITFAYREKQNEIEGFRKKTYQQLAGLKSELLKTLLETNQRKQRLENQFANLPDKSTEFSKNLRYYKLYEQFYLSLMQSKSEFEITQAGSIPDFKILSPATMPNKPLSPDRSMISGIGFVSSLVLMLLLLGVLYLINNKITSITEIEKIEFVPVLGVIPASNHVDDRGLHVIEHPKSVVSEAIRILRTNLDFFSVHTPNKIITISSTVSGEGKSFLAKNLGAVMAYSNKKVILVDLDMRKPKDGSTFDDRTKGVSTILIRKNSWQECLTKTPLENFDFLPSGPHPPNPSELLLNGEFEGLLGDLRNAYDYIILDTPPVGLVTDGIMAMKRSDVSIYIFRANYSKKDFLFNLQRIININKFSNITTILNALPPGEKSYGYGYYQNPVKARWYQKIFKI
ncbi:MAG TPA: polysaccharide biosynthesis tyrosine autokinase, partial [Chryseolinea sp.]|nr:polysaccharide biosynthesis tyrosine autokinase [Chryseolinea sp.]